MAMVCHYQIITSSKLCGQVNFTSARGLWVKPVMMKSLVEHPHSYLLISTVLVSGYQEADAPRFSEIYRIGTNVLLFLMTAVPISLGSGVSILI